MAAAPTLVAARWSLATDASEARCHEPELEGGEWVATGLNEHLLVNRYGAGGHFAPHADGSTVVDFNRRSLFTVLVYLNDVAEGGATQLLSEEERECAIVHDPLSGAAVASAKAVLHAVAPRAGRALVYWHQTTQTPRAGGRRLRKALRALRRDVRARAAAAHRAE